jgi:RNA polymerase-binding transcription factor DksA
VDQTHPELFDPAAVDALEAEIDDISRALERLADGSYGTCEVCTGPIGPAVLSEHPAARHCAAHLPMALS